MKSTAWSKFDNDVVTKLLTWFVIFTTGKTCPLYAGPKNGALACNTIASDIVCVVMCNSGFDFEFNPPMLYYCQSGEWKFYNPFSYSYSQQLPWPDCSSKLTSLLIITISQTKSRPHASGYFWIRNFFLFAYGFRPHASGEFYSE